MGCIFSRLKRQPRIDDLIDKECQIDWGSNVYSDEDIAEIFSKEYKIQNKYRI